MAFAILETGKPAININTIRVNPNTTKDIKLDAGKIKTAEVKQINKMILARGSICPINK